MPRPHKNGLEYFPLDIDFFENDKVCVVRNEYGLKAEIVTIHLLCAVYHHGYFMEWNELTRRKLMAELPGVSVGLLNQIVKSLVRWDFFDKNLFDSAQILTSFSIQTTYFFATRRRKNIPSQMPYLYPGIMDDNGKLLPEISAMFTESGFLSAGMPQKETKGNDNNSLRSSLSPSSSATSSRVGAECFSITAADAVPILKDDLDWLKQMSRRHALPEEHIVKWLDSFVVDCDCRAKRVHENLDDVKRHFCDWLCIQLKQKSGKPRKTKPAAACGSSRLPNERNNEDFRSRWRECQTAICKRVNQQDADRGYSHMVYESYDPVGHVLIVQVPNMEVYEYLEKHCIGMLGKAITYYFGPQCALNYRIVKREDGTS